MYPPLIMHTDCPKCKQPMSCLRKLSSKGELTIQCRQCDFQELKQVPFPRKKIAYLDQFVLSKMVKNASDPYWEKVAELLSRLAQYELVTCPYSPIHVEESNFDSKHRDALKAMYRRFAGDDEFEDSEHIEKHQLARALRAFLKVTESKPTDLHIEDAMKDSPHRWGGDFNIYADFPYDDALIDQLRKDKDTWRDRMEGLCERWRSNPRGFNEQVEKEAQVFESWVEVYRQATNGDPAIFSPFSYPSEIDVVHSLVRIILQIDPDETDPLSIVERFAPSLELRQTPCIFLHCRIWAKIAELAQSPKGPRKPRASDFYDAKVLAHYAPYCDAMFLDNGFREIAEDGRIDCGGKFGVRLFSENNRDDFVTYLQSIEQSAAGEHFLAYEAVYGRDCRQSESTSIT